MGVEPTRSVRPEVKNSDRRRNIGGESASIEHVIDCRDSMSVARRPALAPSQSMLVARLRMRQ
jgi:hypothetical protein